MLNLDYRTKLRYLTHDEKKLINIRFIQRKFFQSHKYVRSNWQLFSVVFECAKIAEFEKEGKMLTLLVDWMLILPSSALSRARSGEEIAKQALAKCLPKN